MNKTLIQKFAERFSIDADNLFEILKATAFRQKAGSTPVTDEQMMALLIVADQYSLNPFTRNLTRGALAAAVETWLANDPSIAGQSARGYGHCAGLG